MGGDKVRVTWQQVKQCGVCLEVEQEDQRVMMWVVTRFE